MNRELKDVRTRRGDHLKRIDEEKLRTLLATFYRNAGYRVDQINTNNMVDRSEANINLKLYKGDAFLIVQCKHWGTKQVPHSAVHELMGVMVNEGATGAFCITSGDFTSAAITVGRKLRLVQLIDGDQLRNMLKPLLDHEPDVEHAEDDHADDDHANNEHDDDVALIGFPEDDPAQISSNHAALLDANVEASLSSTVGPTTEAGTQQTAVDDGSIDVPPRHERMLRRRVRTGERVDRRELLHNSRRWINALPLWMIGGMSLLAAILLIHTLYSRWFAPPATVAHTPVVQPASNPQLEAEPPVALVITKAPSRKQTVAIDALSSQDPLDAAHAKTAQSNPDEAIKVIQGTTPEMWSDTHGDTRHAEKKEVRAQAGKSPQ